MNGALENNLELIWSPCPNAFCSIDLTVTFEREHVSKDNIKLDVMYCFSPQWLPRNICFKQQIIPRNICSLDKICVLNERELTPGVCLFSLSR